MSPTHQRIGVLPGYVLDKVIVGDLDSRFEACMRLSDTVWNTGVQACSTDAEERAWRARYLAYMQARLEALTSAHGRP